MLIKAKTMPTQKSNQLLSTDKTRERPSTAVERHGDFSDSLFVGGKQLTLNFQSKANQTSEQTDESDDSISSNDNALEVCAEIQVE